MLRIKLIHVHLKGSQTSSQCAKSTYRIRHWPVARILDYMCDSFDPCCTPDNWPPRILKTWSGKFRYQYDKSITMKLMTQLWLTTAKSVAVCSYLRVFSLCFESINILNSFEEKRRCIWVVAPFLGIENTCFQCIRRCCTDLIFLECLEYSGFNITCIIMDFIVAWISNHVPGKVWNEITYPFPNFNGRAVEVWEWISNFITRLMMDVITYSCWD